MDTNKRIKKIEDQLNTLKDKDIKRLENELMELKKELGITKAEPVIPMPRIKEEKKTEKPKSFDLESKVGKNIMGILASVLIFAGLGLFVGLIYEYLTDALKILGMYTVSASILILGLFLLMKKNNVFSLSLTGCGIGSIYLSILMTNVYFGYIGDFLMYGLILTWFIGVIYLSSRLKIGINTINIIGQLGILISVILGAFNFSTTQELFLISFFLIATSLAHWMKNSEEGNEILKNISIFTISLSIMIIASNLVDKIFYSQSELVINPFVVLILGIVMIGYNLFINFTYYTNNKSQPWVKGFVIFITSIFLVISAEKFYNVVARMLDINNDVLEVSILSILSFMIYIYAEIKDNSRYVRIGTFLILQVFLLSLAIELDIVKHIGLLLIFAPYLTYGQLSKDKMYTIIGYIYFAFDVIFLFTFWGQLDAYKILEYSLIFLTVASLYGNMILKKENYNITHKIINYILFLIATAKVLYIPGFENKDALSYLALTTINVLAYTSIFTCDWKDIKGYLKKDNKIEKATEYACNIINHILMAVGLTLIYNANTDIGQIIMVSGLVSVCLADNRYLLEKYKDNKYIGFYVGVKSTILINAVMYSFTFTANNSYLISLASIALAAIAIVIGFRLLVKSLRLYGLLLSMISIFKLLLIDIQYDNSIGRVISLIFAGVLCFGINFLYSTASKKINK